MDELEEDQTQEASEEAPLSENRMVCQAWTVALDGWIASGGLAGGGSGTEGEVETGAVATLIEAVHPCMRSSARASNGARNVERE
jgi:hypothetical protein